MIISGALLNGCDIVIDKGDKFYNCHLYRCTIDDTKSDPAPFWDSVMIDCTLRSSVESEWRFKYETTNNTRSL